MGHATHFLTRLERLGYQETELALSLYRDAVLLRAILGMAKIPEAHPRVAIALRHEEGGPHLVVTRAGDFVTCLGEGMAARDLPIVSRSQLDEFSGEIESLRERMKIAQGLVEPGKRTSKLIGRLRDAGHLLSREEFLGISAFSKMLVGEFVQWMLDVSRKTLVRVGGMLPLTHASLRTARVREQLLDLWNDLWKAAHLTALCTEHARPVHEVLESHGGDMTGCSGCPVRLDFRPVALRAVRLMAGIGDGILPRYKGFLRRDNAWEQIEAAAAIFAIGLRHEPSRAEAREELAKLPDLAWGEERLVEDMPRLRGLLLDLLDNPDSALELHAKHGRGDWEAWTRKLAPDAPLRFPDPSSEEARVAAALAGFNSSGSVFYGAERLIVSAGATARLEPEDLYWPANELSEVRKVLDEEWAIQQAAEYLRHLRQLMDDQKPDRVEKKAAPNDRCPCGSGKKFKRCCMGKAA